MKYRGYDIVDSGHGFFLIGEEGNCDYVQEPFATIYLAKAAIDRHLDFFVPFHMGS